MGSAIRTLSGQRKKAHTPGLRIESVDAYPGRVYTHEPPKQTRVVSGPEVVEAGLKSKGFGTALCACLNKSFPTVEAGRTKKPTKRAARNYEKPGRSGAIKNGNHRQY
jgi:hypothetical protein